MKRLLFIAFLFVVAASLAVAQPSGAPKADVLGAHLMYGRGCVGCHAPHGGDQANGGTTQTGKASSILWGEDTSKLVGTVQFGDSYTYTFGKLTDGTAETKGILVCLSCHDGNLTKVGMMKGITFESVTLQGKTPVTVNPPTLLGADGGYNNDHPVGPLALYACGGYNCAGCTISARGQLVPGAGTPLAQFQKDYGLFVSFGTTTPGEVLCTTCHNQHNMSAVAVTAANSGMTAGTYTTMFFLVGPYNPNSANTGANSTAQFCRQCHGYGTNETMGGVNPTIM